jgi:acyl-CoA dehydrogenase
VRRFIETEITPHHRQWEEEGQVSRDVWLKAGSAGFLCSNVPEEFGGVGADFKYNAVLTEELGRAGVTGPGFAIHSDMVSAYISNFGSDLKAIKTTAIRDGDDYVINGQKTYISNAQMCDIIILACKTDVSAGAKGMTFVIVEADRAGFERGRKIQRGALR